MFRHASGRSATLHAARSSLNLYTGTFSFQAAARFSKRILVVAVPHSVQANLWSERSRRVECRSIRTSFIGLRQFWQVSFMNRSIDMLIPLWAQWRCTYNRAVGRSVSRRATIINQQPPETLVGETISR